MSPEQVKDGEKLRFVKTYGNMEMGGWTYTINHNYRCQSGKTPNLKPQTQSEYCINI